VKLYFVGYQIRIEKLLLKEAPKTNTNCHNLQGAPCPLRWPSLGRACGKVLLEDPLLRWHCVWGVREIERFVLFSLSSISCRHSQRFLPLNANSGFWVIWLKARYQFRQHFTCKYFFRKCFMQLFSSFVLALAKGFQQKNYFCTKNACIKCWWSWPQVSISTTI
jgi:hypothetical protein